MAQYTQINRPLEVETVLGKDVLLLERFSGEEAVSVPFRFTLDLLSENSSIPAADLLRSPVTVRLQLVNGGERPINGMVRRFTQLGRSSEGLTAYQAEVVPWFWFLSLTSDCKIFQNLSVLEIVEKVFSDQGYPDFQIKCVKSYPKREYCVQYRETHLNFVSRLLEEEGIFYFFEHSDTKHTLVLADNDGAVRYCPGPKSVSMASAGAGWSDAEAVTELRREHAVCVGKVTLTDYNYLEPSLKLESSLPGDEKGEIYDYPGRYAARDEGERYARLRLEEREALRVVTRGVSNCRSFQSGCRFDLADHYRRDANVTYHLLQVRHSAHVAGYRSGETEEFDYRNEFVAIPYGTPYHPPLTAQKPVVHGSQTAVVVGKSGEEIWVDKHGRVKVQFHWDRDGKKDENSSCWVRVSSTWAGKNWGFVQIPRIGQEVIVDFLEGDPDLPIITGRVYNAEQVPPYALPANQTQSGVKSRSSKGGGAANFNEIRFEDKKGSEELYIHAEKNEQIIVEHNKSESVGANETISIGNDRKETVGGNETLEVAKDRTRKVHKNEDVTVTLTRTRFVGVNEFVAIGGAQEINVGGARTVTVGGYQATTVIGWLSQSVGRSMSLDVGKKLEIDAKDEIVVKTGDSSLTMNHNGTIVLKGKEITIEGTQKIEEKAAEITSEASAKSTTKGGAVNVEADTITTVKGATVKINC